MQSRVLKALAAMLLLAPIGGQAADFGYSFVDFAVIPEAEVDVGNDDIDGDGFQLRGSLVVSQNYFAMVEIADLGFDDDIDFTRWIIGGGGHWPLTQSLDFVGRGGLVRYDADYGRFGGDDDDLGFFLSGRVRALVAPRVEVEGGVELSTAEVDGIEDNVTLVGEGRYHFNNQFSVGGLLNIGDDFTQVGVYGRFNF